MREFEEWICSQVGQVWCVIIFCVAVFAFVMAVIFDDKWGD